MKKLILPTILLLLISCKKDVNVSNDFTFQKEFVSRDYLPIIEGTLNNKKAYFLLDTGASISILNLSQAQEYNFTVGQSLDFDISGYGGVSNDVNMLHNANCKIGSVSLNKEFLGKDITYLIKVVRKGTSYNIVGIIGNNNIAGNNLILDFETNNILKRK